MGCCGRRDRCVACLVRLEVGFRDTTDRAFPIVGNIREASARAADRYRDPPVARHRSSRTRDRCTEAIRQTHRSCRKFLLRQARHLPTQMLDRGRYDGDEMRLANPPLRLRRHQISARALMKESRLGCPQRELGTLCAGVQHVQKIVAVALVWRESKLHDSSRDHSIRPEVRLDGVQELIDVAERRLHFPHRIDAAFDDSQRHPGCSNMKMPRISRIKGRDGSATMASSLTK